MLFLALFPFKQIIWRPRASSGFFVQSPNPQGKSARFLPRQETSPSTWGDGGGVDEEGEGCGRSMAENLRSSRAALSTSWS